MNQVDVTSILLYIGTPILITGVVLLLRHWLGEEYCRLNILMGFFFERFPLPVAIILIWMIFQSLMVMAYFDIKG